MSRQSSVNLESEKSIIRSCLIANNGAGGDSNGGLTLARFLSLYRELNDGRLIPYRELGFRSIVSFLDSLDNDVVRLSSDRTSELRIYPIVSERTAHIHELVSRQKSGGRGGGRGRTFTRGGGGGWGRRGGGSFSGDPVGARRFAHYGGGDGGETSTRDENCNGAQNNTHVHDRPPRFRVIGSGGARERSTTNHSASAANDEWGGVRRERSESFSGRKETTTNDDGWSAPRDNRSGDGKSIPDGSAPRFGGENGLSTLFKGEDDQRRGCGDKHGRANDDGEDKIGDKKFPRRYYDEKEWLTNNVDETKLEKQAAAENGAGDGVHRSDHRTASAHARVTEPKKHSTPLEMNNGPVSNDRYALSSGKGIAVEKESIRLKPRTKSPAVQKSIGSGCETSTSSASRWKSKSNEKKSIGSSTMDSSNPESSMSVSPAKNDEFGFNDSNNNNVGLGSTASTYRRQSTHQDVPNQAKPSTIRLSGVKKSSSDSQQSVGVSEANKQHMTFIASQRNKTDMVEDNQISPTDFFIQETRCTRNRFGSSSSSPPTQKFEFGDFAWNGKYADLVTNSSGVSYGDCSDIDRRSPTQKRNIHASHGGLRENEAGSSSPQTQRKSQGKEVGDLNIGDVRSKTAFKKSTTKNEFGKTTNHPEDENKETSAISDEESDSSSSSVSISVSGSGSSGSSSTSQSKSNSGSSSSSSASSSQSKSGSSSRSSSSDSDSSSSTTTSLSSSDSKRKTTLKNKEFGFEKKKNQHADEVDTRKRFQKIMSSNLSTDSNDEQMNYEIHTPSGDISTKGKRVSCANKIQLDNASSDDDQEVDMTERHQKPRTMNMGGEKRRNEVYDGAQNRQMQPTSSQQIAPIVGHSNGQQSIDNFFEQGPMLLQPHDDISRMESVGSSLEAAIKQQLQQHQPHPPSRQNFNQQPEERLFTASEVASLIANVAKLNIAGNNLKTPQNTSVFATDVNDKFLPSSCTHAGEKPFSTKPTMNPELSEAAKRSLSALGDLAASSSKPPFQTIPVISSRKIVPETLQTPNKCGGANFPFGEPNPKASLSQQVPNLPLSVKMQLAELKSLAVDTDLVSSRNKRPNSFASPLPPLFTGAERHSSNANSSQPLFFPVTETHTARNPMPNANAAFASFDPVPLPISQPPTGPIYHVKPFQPFTILVPVQDQQSASAASQAHFPPPPLNAPVSSQRMTQTNVAGASSQMSAAAPCFFPLRHYSPSEINDLNASAARPTSQTSFSAQDFQFSKAQTYTKP